MLRSPRRNLYAKLPDRERERVKHAYWQALDEAISEADAKRRLQKLVDQLDKGGFTAAARCLADDLDALVVHLRYPVRHRRRWRSTNLLERSLGEVKRRTKVMGRFPGETSCLTLVWAVLDLLITHQTNGINFNALDRQRLKRARYQGNEQTIPEEVTAAQTDHHREPYLQHQRDATSAKHGVRYGMDGLFPYLAGLSATDGQPERAAFLLGAAHAFGYPDADEPPMDQRLEDEFFAAARRDIGHAAWEQAERKGEMLSYDEALAYAEQAAGFRQADEQNEALSASPPRRRS